MVIHGTHSVWMMDHENWVSLSFHDIQIEYHSVFMIFKQALSIGGIKNSNCYFNNQDTKIEHYSSMGM